MKPLAIFLFIFIHSYNSLSQSINNISNIKWYISPAFYREDSEKINQRYINLNFTMISDSIEIVVLDYNEIYKSLQNKQGCIKETPLFWEYLNDTLDHSHLFIENQDSMIISYYENRINPSYIFDIYPINDIKEYDYSFLQLSKYNYVHDKLRYTIPQLCLHVCKKSTAIRLIYLQNPNEYQKKMGIRKQIIISNWFNMSDIR